jgi:hypothetical protein
MLNELEQLTAQLEREEEHLLFCEALFSIIRRMSIKKEDPGVNSLISHAKHELVLLIDSVVKLRLEVRNLKDNTDGNIRDELALKRERLELLEQEYDRTDDLSFIPVLNQLRDEVYQLTQQQHAEFTAFKEKIEMSANTTKLGNLSIHDLVAQISQQNALVLNAMQQHTQTILNTIVEQNQAILQAIEALQVEVEEAVDEPSLEQIELLENLIESEREEDGVDYDEYVGSTVKVEEFENVAPVDVTIPRLAIIQSKGELTDEAIVPTDMAMKSSMEIQLERLFVPSNNTSSETIESITDNYIDDVHLTEDMQEYLSDTLEQAEYRTLSEMYSASQEEMSNEGTVSSDVNVEVLDAIEPMKSIDTNDEIITAELTTDDDQFQDSLSHWDEPQSSNIAKTLEELAVKEIHHKMQESVNTAWKILYSADLPEHYQFIIKEPVKESIQEVVEETSEPAQQTFAPVAQEQMFDVEDTSPVTDEIEDTQSIQEEPIQQRIPNEERFHVSTDVRELLQDKQGRKYRLLITKQADEFVSSYNNSKVNWDKLDQLTEETGLRWFLPSQLEINIMRVMAAKGVLDIHTGATYMTCRVQPNKQHQDCVVTYKLVPNPLMAKHNCYNANYHLADLDSEHHIRLVAREYL